MYSGRATYVQSQHPHAIGQNAPIPMSIPGMVSRADYITFQLDSNFPKDAYRVMVPVLVGPPYHRDAGYLSPAILLPNAQFDPNGKIVLVPSSRDMAFFEAPMKRGGHYIVPSGEVWKGGKTISMPWSF